MDITKQLIHQPRNVQELAQAAQEAWSSWQDGPRNSPEHEEAMTKLGAALSLFAMGPARDPRERQSKPDPRQHGPT